ncbi:hypothetical protein COJ21_22485 [Priestia megaterium]|nr:hypothetical protein COJ21_22485 [Priestia megaterium]
MKKIDYYGNIEELENKRRLVDLKWENVARGILIVIILTFLPPFLDKLGTSFWFKWLSIIVMLFGGMYILSKIKILQIQVTKKVGWLTLIAAFIIITVIFYLF